MSKSLILAAAFLFISTSVSAKEPHRYDDWRTAVGNVIAKLSHVYNGIKTGATEASVCYSVGELHERLSRLSFEGENAYTKEDVFVLAQVVGSLATQEQLHQAIDKSPRQIQETLMDDVLMKQSNKVELSKDFYRAVKPQRVLLEKSSEISALDSKLSNSYCLLSKDDPEKVPLITTLNEISEKSAAFLDQLDAAMEK